MDHHYRTEPQLFYLNPDANCVTVNYTCFLHTHASVFKFPMPSVTNTGERWLISSAKDKKIRHQISNSECTLTCYVVG
jgi:hypothetical protein